MIETLTNPEVEASSELEAPAAPAVGVIYTETVIHAAPEQFVKDAPYQLAIVTLENGGRLTARIAGDRVAIADKVEQIESRDGIPFFRKK